ncbi:ABC-2 type transport system permease protein [Clostridium cavendishii DSM 21758]|uniref:ABC-2 type transport system permease protein n=1 Tax=Clostridium cavendishii DSM 21758 TaxID=1121302 RepID=A0A1M6H0Z9_9CLOT|nr:ABC transporter permease [Clostridium cavendishii]SHJ15826.1 ABC-2 type transport system permease protein [Clostridium cavendishii DSM 21758]
MTIFQTTLKRLIRSKSNLIFLVVLPLVFMLIAFSGSNGTPPLKIAVVDKDKSELSQSIIKNIEAKSSVTLEDENNIQNKLINNDIDYAIVIPEDFSKSFINGDSITLQGFEAKEGNTSQAVKLSLDSYMNNLKSFVKNSKGNEETFYKALKYYENGSYKVSYLSVDKGEGNKAKTLAAMGFIVMNMLFSASSATNIILKDKEKNVFTRLFTTPLSRFRYVLESLLAFFTITVTQVTLYFLMFKYVFKFNLGDTPLNIYLLFLIFGIFTVSMGVFIATHSKNLRQSGSMSTLISLPFAMLGGCFWPRDIMPDILKNISNFIPTTWINTANSDVLFGSNLVDVSTNIALLLGLTLILLAMSSNKLKNNQ